MPVAGKPSCVELPGRTAEMAPRPHYLAVLNDEDWKKFSRVIGTCSKCGKGMTNGHDCETIDWTGN